MTTIYSPKAIEEMVRALQAADAAFDQLDAYPWPQSEADEFYGRDAKCPVDIAHARNAVKEAIAMGLKPRN